MRSLKLHFLRFWRWIFKRKATESTSELSQKLVADTDFHFDFKPNVVFHSYLGNNMQFNVMNPLDLFLQERGLMAEALVVEAVKDDRRLVLWFRYSATDLSSRGESDCILFADVGNRTFDGVCGVVSKKRRI